MCDFDRSKRNGLHKSFKFFINQFDAHFDLEEESIL